MSVTGFEFIMLLKKIIHSFFISKKWISKLCCLKINWIPVPWIKHYIKLKLEFGDKGKKKKKTCQLVNLA